MEEDGGTSGAINGSEAQFTCEKLLVMGDKSPKANQKKASQNQVKSNSASQKKKQAEVAKQATKLAPPKKK